jgi:hypothetical protein
VPGQPLAKLENSLCIKVSHTKAKRFPCEVETRDSGIAESPIWGI